jgi:hypothetical protein
MTFQHRYLFALSGSPVLASISGYSGIGGSEVAIERHKVLVPTGFRIRQARQYRRDIALDVDPF